MDKKYIIEKIVHSFLNIKLYQFYTLSNISLISLVWILLLSVIVHIKRYVQQQVVSRPSKLVSSSRNVDSRPSKVDSSSRNVDSRPSKVGSSSRNVDSRPSKVDSKRSRVDRRPRNLYSRPMTTI